MADARSSTDTKEREVRPLFDALVAYKGVKARFHMPSHSGATLPEDEGLYLSAPFDVTELSFSDNLSISSGVILDAECLAAHAYGAENTLFFTAGATDALRTALLCVRERRIAYLGDMHKSFHAAKRLFSLDVTDISSAEEIEKGDFGAVAVTSPDYYGKVRDLSLIAEKCRATGAILIVDEAHGAHFAFSPLLPKSAVEVADFVIHGAHKTLPVYTGGAMLHVRDAFYKKARETRSEVIGTSPSYLVMASLDYARDLFEREGERMYASLKGEIDRVKAAYPQVEVLLSDDFSRLVISRRGGALALAARWEKEGIFVEAADADRAVLICTPYNVSALERAFSIAAEYHGENAKYPDISDIIGRVSVYDVGVYPPGVPVVKAGEIISEEMAAILQANLDRLFGTIDGRIITK